MIKNASPPPESQLVEKLADFQRRVVLLQPNQPEADMTKCVLSFFAGMAITLAAVFGLTEKQISLPIMDDGVYRTFMVAPMFDQTTGKPVYWVVAILDPLVRL